MSTRCMLHQNHAAGAGEWDSTLSRQLLACQGAPAHTW
jgi:hypothetical protein